MSTTRGERTAQIGARRVLVEPPQHRVEHTRAVVVRPHAVRQMHVDRRVVARVIDQLAEPRVERRVDGAERIAAERAALLGVVPRMGLVVHLPELVAGAVRLAEHREEEVPVALVEQIARERGLLRDAFEDLGEQRLILGGRAVLARRGARCRTARDAGTARSGYRADAGRTSRRSRRGTTAGTTRVPA